MTQGVEARASRQQQHATEPMQPTPARSVGTAGSRSWWQVAALAFGLALAMAAYFPAQGMSALGDRYDAVVTLALGLVCIATACAMAAYDSTMRRLPRAAGMVIGAAVAVPVLFAVLVPIGSELAWVAYYVAAVGLVCAFTRRTAPATVFGLLTLVPLPFYLTFGRVFGPPSM